MPWATDLPADRRPQRQVLALSDGYETSMLVHRRPGPRRLPVLYVHGIQSHPGWFVGSGAHLADAGHDVYQVTRRGSGDNEMARGHADGAGQLLDDVQVACRHVLAECGADRLHLVGVSWGGKLLLAYAAHARRQAPLASLTLVAPGLVPFVDLPLATKLAIGVCVLSAPYRYFDIPLNDVELFTDNEAMRRYLREDPCRLHRATARLLYASRQLDRLLARAAGGATGLPVTLLLASRDRIIDNTATEVLAGRVAGGDLVIRTLDAAHSLEFEPDPGPFFQELLAGVTRGEP